MVSGMLKRLPSGLRILGATVILGALWGQPAVAEAPDLYLSALSRIEGLYLERDLVEPVAMLRSAGEALEDEIEWVLAEPVEGGVRLRAGDGRELGSVRVQGWDDLDESLRALEALVRDAGLPLDDPELDVIVMGGATNALDRHSRLLYGERLQAFDKRLRGTYSGVGARLAERDQELILDEVFAGNPAWQAGLKSGDVLVSVDGSAVLGMRTSDAASLMQGEAGTQVVLVVRRQTPEGEREMEFVVTRAQVREPNVSWKVLADGIGYVRIDHFSELTEDYLLQGLEELDEQSALERGLVIDLRNNTGGSMMQSARSADAFVESGDLVRTVGPDGGKVRGLVEHLWAEDDGTEPDIPIVVLQNHRTASGSEILAGSLRELDRAVLIGTRSYGKGTVQKVYTLRDDVRLKLTVAQYLLSGGLSIHDEHGVPADLPIGRVRFDEAGVLFIHDYREPGGPEPLLFVDDPQQDGADREGYWEELAVRVLAQAGNQSDRVAVLDAAGQVRELVRVEEEQRLVAAFAARGVDWRAAGTLGPAPKVQVELRTEGEARAGQAVELVARVTNLGDEPIHRVVVRLDSGDRTWTRYVLPVGFLTPGQTGEARAEIVLPFDLQGRESSVGMVVQSDGRPEVDAGTAVLGYQGIPQPELGLKMALVQESTGTYAELRLQNQATHPLQGVRARFEVAPSSGIQLTEYEAVVPSVAAEGSVSLRLGLDLTQVPDGSETLPLELVVETNRFGTIARYPVSLPTDGSAVHLRAPRIRLEAPLAADVGPLTLSAQVQDERALDHVVIWHEGTKLAWHAGSGRSWSESFVVDLEAGRNAIVILAEDDQGLRSWEKVYVRGVPAPVVGDSPSEELPAEP